MLLQNIPCQDLTRGMYGSMYVSDTSSATLWGSPIRLSLCCYNILYRDQVEKFQTPLGSKFFIKYLLNFRGGITEDSFSKCSMYNVTFDTQTLQQLNDTEHKETGKNCYKFIFV